MVFIWWYSWPGPKSENLMAPKGIQILSTATDFQFDPLFMNILIKLVTLQLHIFGFQNEKVAPSLQVQNIHIFSMGHFVDISLDQGFAFKYWIIEQNYHLSGPNHKQTPWRCLIIPCRLSVIFCIIVRCHPWVIGSIILHILVVIYQPICVLTRKVTSWCRGVE